MTAAPVLDDTAPAPTPARARTVRPLLSELRRGVGPWAGAALALTVSIAMYGKADYIDGWQSRWGEATSLLRTAGLLLGGPLAVAAGCWQGGRERRRGTGELWASTARTPLRRAAVAAAPAALWPALGHLLAATGCLLATWPYVSAGRPDLLLVLADAVALAALGTLGFVAGRVIPWRLTAPLLAAATYVVLGFPAYGNTPWQWLDPAMAHSYNWDKAVWWFAPASVVWTGGLAATAFLAYAARRRTLALPPLAAACAAAVLIGTGNGGHGPWRADTAAARLVCDDGTPQVCVTAVDSRLLPQVSAALADLNGALRGVPGAPVRWTDGPRPTGPDEASLPTPAFESLRGRLRDPGAYAHGAVQYLFSDSCEDQDYEHPGWARASEVNSAVIQWLAPSAAYEPVLTDRSRADLARLQTKSPAERRAYLARYLAADLCDAEEVPVP
ncbi:hypothetical protein [Streptomyces purpureus]|uniref:hypothetical protein n=1 Tax=Streptomyces purpureus TaxID=1951 RepID=UPI00037E11B8|nr:hypothetical protein [Streptomyces purpureus]